MSALFTTIDYAPYLKMKHQTMNMFCLESVSPECYTIKDALAFREGLDDIDDYEIINIK